MIIGVPKEIKVKENRVGLVPSGVKELVKQGCQVFIEKDAGAGIGLSDGDYEKAGARVVPSASEIYAKAEMIVKVKEPQAAERKMLKPKQILFTFLHLAPDPEQAKDLMASGASCIAYETIADPQGRLPLLAPMSEVAGRLSIQVGSYHLMKHLGGFGRLMGGVPGVKSANVVVLGGGVVGLNATKMAVGLGASVSILDANIDALRRCDDLFQNRVRTLYSNSDNIENAVLKADLVIGAALIKGAAAPKLVSKELLNKMKPGSVLVDVAIDQGGCFESSKATTHDEPTYVVGNVVHYCVANMPGAVPVTSTAALTNATLPYVLKLAKGGVQSLKNDPYFLGGLNVYEGKITCKEVGESLGLEYSEAKDLL